MKIKKKSAVVIIEKMKFDDCGGWVDNPYRIGDLMITFFDHQKGDVVNGERQVSAEGVFGYGELEFTGTVLGVFEHEVEVENIF